MDFFVDNISLIKQIKTNIENNIYDLDIFFNGITLSATVDDLDLDLFGCWNGGCKDALNDSHKESIHQEYLVRLLNQYNDKNDKNDNFSKNKLRFLFGDNIYFDKNIKKVMKIDKDLKKKISNAGILDKIPLLKIEEVDINLKETSQKLLDDGFRCMREKPTFMCLGNHDIEPLFVIHQQIKKSYENILISEDKVKFNSNWIQPTAFYAVELKVKDILLLFIIIDTNFLENGYNEKIIPNITKNRDNMFRWIEEILSKHRTHFKIVIGHCPIFYYSHKEKEPQFLSNLISLENPSNGQNFIKLYELLIKYGVKIYMAADEHNLQYIYDSQHDLIHLTCGASPGGGADETKNFIEEQELQFASTQIDIPTEVKDKLIKRLVLNAPSFMKLTVNTNMIQINLVGPSDLSQHSSLMCKKYPERCIHNKPDTTIPEVYSIITIPKYLEYISIYDCEKYKLTKCNF
jgi:hypothetical protein